MRLCSFAVLSSLILQITASSWSPRDAVETTQLSKRALLQDIVTWDANSLFIHGKRVVIYGGEFHPFRLPVPSLWLDIFQKMRSMGYNAASVYWDWALLEGQQGDYSASGVFDVGLFLDLAKQAGMYIIARPGPYINAEVSGGGFPGWLQRNPAHLRTNETGFLEATYNYINNIGKTISDAQITNGGAVILFQPENEYLNGFATGFSPNVYYVQDVEDEWRNTGIVMPYTDNYGHDHFLPGSGIGAIDLYGSDSYPQGFSCNDPYNWLSSDVQTNEYQMFEIESNSTPPMIPEFQGGSFDPWGGAGFGNCSVLTNEDFEKVFYKNNFASALKIVSYYMTFGGTNWGNLGYPLGYTSYDYGAAITENRELTRAKYSEAKLIANFWQASPAYLTASPEKAQSAAIYTTQANLTVTPVIDSNSETGFYVIRHDGPEGTTNYKLNLPTSKGIIQIPQIQGSLTLVAKDSKIHLADYAIGSYNVLYSSAEIFTQQNYSKYSVAVFYGGLTETHELAFSGAPNATIVSGSGVTVSEIDGATILNWQTSSSRKVVQIGSDLYVYLIDRNSAYNYWVTYLPGTDSDPFGTFSTSQPVVINGGYLIRNTTLSGSSLYVTGDLNTTTTIEVIGAPSSLSCLYFNGVLVNTITGTAPTLSGQVIYNVPYINLPSLASLNWKSIDSLPELSSSYDDSLWTAAVLTYTNNTYRPNLTTPNSLYASDYGYNTGTLLFRGHFTATGSENGTVELGLAGGEAFSSSVWLNSTFIGSYNGVADASSANVSYGLPSLTTGDSYVVNVIIDQTGFEESQTQGADIMKAPRGILSYNVSGYAPSAVSWKLTGNLHGEAYEDRARGPLNEGGMFAERQGYHLPSPPSSNWTSSSPLTGTSGPGVAFYSSSLDLALPAGYDVPLYFGFPGASNTSNYRCQLFVNGWQFGKYGKSFGPYFQMLPFDSRR
ncbi:hypothetical protein LTR56_023569 [Elasticomyces elasticus]|nr:hypothetical protein LTR56_023569 [Elasticomyces elasticus]